MTDNTQPETAQGRMPLEQTSPEQQRIVRLRFAIGLVQGIGLYWLYGNAQAHAWPATVPTLFVPMVIIGIYWPLVLSFGVGTLRPRTFRIWGAVSFVLLAGLGFYDRYRMGADAADITKGNFFILMFAAFVWLFIAQALVTAGDIDRKWIARYETYFDIAWKQGVQGALGWVFVSAFWSLLYLGAGLFALIHITFLGELIWDKWFAIPATALAVALSIHVTEMRINLVRGARTLALNLMSFLLPVFVVIAGTFTLSLSGTGLELLWKTRYAAWLLLAAALHLSLLLNATYQDGRADHRPGRVFRLAAIVAAAILFIPVLLAAYAFLLRVHQYGWTEPRIWGFACTFVAICYAIGYARAAAQSLRGAWLDGIAQCNVVTAFVILAVLLALFSPIADAARIAVDSQLLRLQSGDVTAEKFDYAYLRFSGARWGDAALKQLAATSNDAEVKKRVAEVLKRTDRYSQPPEEPAVTSNIAMGANLTVYPKGRTLPDSFLKTDWAKAPSDWGLHCMNHRDRPCDAYLIDVNGDGHDEVLLTGNGGDILLADTDGTWAVRGTVGFPFNCDLVQKAMKAGDFRLVAPEHPVSDMEIGAIRLPITVSTLFQTCPKTLDSVPPR